MYMAGLLTNFVNGRHSRLHGIIVLGCGEDVIEWSSADNAGHDALCWH